MALDFMPGVVLRRHPESSAGAGLTISVLARRRPAGRLSLKYNVEGDLSDLNWPPPGAPVQADELWRTTCMEAFVSGGPGYVELNFAPTLRWAAYRFESYRTGMAARSLEQLQLRASRALGLGSVEAEFEAPADLPEHATWRLALTAVLEHASGERSYWSAHHPPGKPDFHHPDSFVVESPPPEAQ